MVLTMVVLVVLLVWIGLAVGLTLLWVGYRHHVAPHALEEFDGQRVPVKAGTREERQLTA